MIDLITRLVSLILPGVGEVLLLLLLLLSSANTTRAVCQSLDQAKQAV